MGLHIKVIETFKGFGHEGGWEVVPKIVKAHTYRFILCEVLVDSQK